MAYRRKHGMGRSSTFKEERYSPSEDGDIAAPYSPSSSLAAQAIMATAAHRDSSHSSANGNSGFKDHAKGGRTYDYTSTDSGSFWGVLARKAKAILDDDDGPYQPEYHGPRRPGTTYSSMGDQVDISKKLDNPTLRKGLDVLTSSMNRIGDTIGNAFEEGRTIVEHKTADFIQETRKIQIVRKGANEGQSQNPASQEDQLKASRDVAMATAAKAKLLLRELKTVKADLTFAKERCSQLEEENKILRDAREKGVNPADDDMIRLQLETLLEEKARLAHENSLYARENRFLREIVEYHQLTMQDVVYLDEGIEEVTEVYPIPAVARRLSISPPSPVSPRLSYEVSLPRSYSVPKDIRPAPLPPRDSSR